jgi:hypothetical protein
MNHGEGGGAHATQCDPDKANRPTNRWSNGLQAGEREIADTTRACCAGVGSELELMVDVAY